MHDTCHKSNFDTWWIALPRPSHVSEPLQRAGNLTIARRKGEIACTSINEEEALHLLQFKPSHDLKGLRNSGVSLQMGF